MMSTCALLQPLRLRERRVPVYIAVYTEVFFGSISEIQKLVESTTC